MKDKKILLYAGTTEGRKLASYLGRRGVRLHVCVATAYGESLLPEEKNITVTHDRMDSGQMGEFMRVFEPDYVIDATHPYAKEVTKNLKSACEVMQVPYLRLVRGSEETKESICVENMDEAIKYLEKTEGNILVTTGSKELESYTRLTDYESRVYARVLSIGQVAVNCEELGFSGRHLICMQGPFSTEMNRAMLKEYDIAYMVTKESGLAGGYPQKCQAALEAGVKMVVIGRPEEEEGMNFEEMSKFLQKELELDNHWKVTLVGIGAGARDQVTLEAKRCCQEAELLIGAGRMIEAVAEVGQTIYEAYRPDEIISYIKENPEYENVTIQSFPDMQYITSYARADSITRKSPAELKALRQAGLNHLYSGMETGSDQILKLINKGFDADIVVRSGCMAKEADMILSEFILLGIGGKELSEENAAQTAKALNIIQPDFIRVHATGIKPESKLGEFVRNGSFALQSEEEIVVEQKLFLQQLHEMDSYYVNEHIVNLLLEIRGNLRTEKQEMLSTIDRFLTLPPDERLLFAVGRRLNIFFRLDDLKKPKLHQKAEESLQQIVSKNPHVDFAALCNYVRQSQI